MAVQLILSPLRIRSCLPQAPKISTSREATRNVKGAAAVNLSGSEMIENKASRSAVM